MVKHRFFIQQNGNVLGPYKASELLKMDLSPETPVSQDPQSGIWSDVGTINFEAESYIEEAESFFQENGECENSKTESGGEEMQRFVNDIYNYTTRRMVNNDVSAYEMYNDLIKTQGLSEEDAKVVVNNVSEEIRKQRNGKAEKNAIIGGIVALIGLLVTIVTYSNASGSGGTYIVAWGAILYGGIQFFRGVTGFQSKQMLDDKEIEKQSQATSLVGIKKEITQQKIEAHGGIYAVIREIEAMLKKDEVLKTLHIRYGRSKNVNTFCVSEDSIVFYVENSRITDDLECRINRILDSFQ